MSYTLGKNLTRALALASIFAAMDSVAGNTHYRWLNERGIPVHSDRPPPKGIDYEVISTGSSFKRVVSSDEGAVPLETESRAGNEFDRVNSDAAKRSKKNAELCEKARTNLDSLTNSERVKVRDSQGEERFLTAEEIEVETQTAKAQISVYCK